MKIRYVGTDLHDLADEFMSHDHRHRDRLLRPGIPLIDVNVGAADAGAIHVDKHVVDAYFGPGNIFEPETRLRIAFDEGFHDSVAILTRLCPVSGKDVRYSRIMIPVCKIYFHYTRQL